MRLNLLKFLNSRGITDEVIKNNKIVASVDGKSIVFPYLVNGQIDTVTIRRQTKTAILKGKARERQRGTVRGRGIGRGIGGGRS